MPEASISCSVVEISVLWNRGHQSMDGMVIVNVYMSAECLFNNHPSNRVLPIQIFILLWYRQGTYFSYLEEHCDSGFPITSIGSFFLSALAAGENARFFCLFICLFPCFLNLFNARVIIYKVENLCRLLIQIDHW